MTGFCGHGEKKEVSVSIVLNVLKWLAFVVLGVGVAIALYLFGMRFADGPSGFIAGGAFSTGEAYQGAEPDWLFVKDRSEVEFQLLDPDRSRTTWIVEYEGRIYIPCGYMNSTWGRIWKQWPIEAEKDGRAILRVDGVLYDRKLVRIKEGAQIPYLLSELVRKYYFNPDAPLMSAEQREQAAAGAMNRLRDESLWIFELAPRA